MQRLDASLLAKRIPRRFRAVEERFGDGNAIQLLRDGAEAFPVMLETIEAADHQVLLEMYWFDSDRTGRRFADALARAAQRGVEVAVIYDSVGSFSASSTFFEEMCRAGVKVLEYNPVMPWRKRFRLGFLTRRDHRKILVVDGAVAFTGGINLADQWAPVTEDGGGWRDDVIRVEGPTVAAFIDAFSEVWRRQAGPPLERLTRSRAAPCGSQKIRVLGTAPFSKSRREIVRAYVSNIWKARRRVWIANSYFVPDGSVIRALREAALRGVDVRILVPGISDVEIVRHASRGVWTRLLPYGVRIFEWNKNILHAKTAVIDGVWSTIGTFNLDYRSLLWNLEINVSVYDEAFGARMEESLARDFDQSTEVSLHDLRFRSLGDRLLEAVFYRFRKLL